jgi:hypothetical protein
VTGTDERRPPHSGERRSGESGRLSARVTPQYDGPDLDWLTADARLWRLWLAGYQRGGESGYHRGYDEGYRAAWADYAGAARLIQALRPSESVPHAELERRRSARVRLSDSPEDIRDKAAASWGLLEDQNRRRSA